MLKNILNMFKNIFQKIVPKIIPKVTGFVKENLVLAIIVVVVIVGIFAMSVYSIYFKGGDRMKILTAQVAGQKAIDYINNSILKGQGTVSLKETQEVSGLYKIKITFEQQDQKQDSDIYVTKDGKYLFPVTQGVPIDLDGKPTTEASNDNTEISKTDKPEVELFVMAFCPYGNQAEDTMNPVINLLGNKFDFVMRYIISKDSSGKYNSLHGDQELHQDIREICVSKYQKDKSWKFIEAINKDCTAQNADTCWEKVASGLGIDVQKTKDCQSSEGNSLLDQEISAVGKYGVTGSPQLFINGVEYKGSRDSESYKNGICSGFNTQPAECQQELSTAGASAQGGCE